MNSRIKRRSKPPDRKAAVNAKIRYQYSKKRDAHIIVQTDPMDADLQAQRSTAVNSVMELEEEVNELRGHNTYLLLREGAKFICDINNYLLVNNYLYYHMKIQPILLFAGFILEPVGCVNQI